MVTPALRKLARSYGIQTNYRDVHARRIDAEPEVLVNVLRTLGASIEHAQHTRDAEEALLRKRRARPRARLVPERTHARARTRGRWDPLLVDTASFFLRFPTATIDYMSRWDPSRRRRSSFARRPVAYRDPARGKRWGLFAPLYALHSKHSGGIGNFGDLRRFAELTLAHGGGFVATLPLLASLPDEPSPYSPSSRLFWNELYVDAGTASPKTPSELLDYPELHRAKRATMRPGRASDVAAFQSRFPLAWIPIGHGTRLCAPRDRIARDGRGHQLRTEATLIKANGPRVEKGAGELLEAI